MRVRAAVALGLGLFIYPALAGAYCRQHSCQDSVSVNAEGEEVGDRCERDARGCIIEGDELFHGSPCLSFAIAQGSGEFLGVSDERLDALVLEAFERWQSVDCGGGESPRLNVQSVGTVATDEPFYCDVAELNLNVWLLDPSWSHDADALGYTTSTYAQDNAEVFDADVEINVEKILREGLAEEFTEDVLLSIFTHEAGHFLGLGHSDDFEAVMAASYSPRDLLSRPLTQDDIDGICEAFPPGKDLECSERSYAEAALDEPACEAAIEELGQSDETGCALAGPSANFGASSQGHRDSGLGALLSAVALAWSARRLRAGRRVAAN